MTKNTTYANFSVFQEPDNEIKGDGNSWNYKYSMHSLSRYRFSSDRFSSRSKLIVGNPRIGRFFAVDPLEAKYPWNNPYAFSGNRVIYAVELEGLEKSQPFYLNDGKTMNPNAVQEDLKIGYND